MAQARIRQHEGYALFNIDRETFYEQNGEVHFFTYREIIEFCESISSTTFNLILVVPGRFDLMKYDCEFNFLKAVMLKDFEDETSILYRI